MSPLKLIGEVFVHIVIPAFSTVLFVGTFVGGVLKEVESLYVKVPIALLATSIALFYFARFRKIWKEGTRQHHENQKNQKD